MPPKTILSIEGNIGAGKSTLLAELPRLLPETVPMTLVPEPVDQWCASGVLGLFYSTPQRWAYSFQSYAFLSRLKSQVAVTRQTSAGVVVLERSVWSDKHVFAAHCRASGLFAEPAEATMYDEWHTWLMDDMFPNETRLDGIIYLRATPDVCLARLRARGRPEEAELSLAYLEALHARHEAWLMPTRPSPAPNVLVLDATQPIEAFREPLRAFLARSI
jgi:deoxycitidine kinase